MNLLNEQSHSGPEIGKHASYSIIDCQSCGFIHSLLESGTDHQELYTSHFYDEEKPDYIKNNQEDADWWDFTYGLRIERADELTPQSTKSWLDIGTGPGYFLDSAVKREKRVIGIEPGILAADHASSKGHRVINDYFNEKTSSDLGVFDGIHCSEVLEHVPDPLSFLRTIQLNMDSNSILCTVVPNDFSLIQKIYTSDTQNHPKWWIGPPFHLNYFSKVSLRNLLQKSGLKVIYETSMFPIDLFLLMGDNYVGNERIGKEAHNRRKAMEMAFKNSGNISILNRLYEEMTKLGIGRELVFFSRLDSK